MGTKGKYLSRGPKAEPENKCERTVVWKPKANVETNICSKGKG